MAESVVGESGKSEFTPYLKGIESSDILI